MNKRKRRTTIRTSIKDKPLLFVSETVTEVNELLQDRNKFIMLKGKGNASTKASKIVIPKSAVKLVSMT